MPASAASRPARAMVPVTLTIKESTSREFATVHGKLHGSLGAIEKGVIREARVSLAGAGAPFLTKKDLRKGDQFEFTHGGARFSVRVLEIDIPFLGADSAVFFIKDAASKAIPENEKIDRLIESVAKMDGASFIRNGSSYASARAADHLRSKRNSAGSRIETAAQFIEHIASRSSTTGEAYQIKLPSGETVFSEDYFTRRLKEMEEELW